MRPPADIDPRRRSGKPTLAGDPDPKAVAAMKPRAVADEPPSLAFKLAAEFMMDFEVGCSCWNANKALQVAADRVLATALQAERDKERDAVVAWLRESSKTSGYDHDISGHVLRTIADFLTANQHRSEHV